VPVFAAPPVWVVAEALAAGAVDEGAASLTGVEAVGSVVPAELPSPPVVVLPNAPLSSSVQNWASAEKEYQVQYHGSCQNMARTGGQISAIQAKFPLQAGIALSASGRVFRTTTMENGNITHWSQSACPFVLQMHWVANRPAWSWAHGITSFSNAVHG
jgi:hypothetical protein